MTKIAMPEPAGLTTPENLHSVHGGEAALMFWSVSMRAEGEVALYTTAQMEAYAAANVREALGQVIQNLEAESAIARGHKAYSTVLALMSQAELIRVSIEKQ